MKHEDKMSMHLTIYSTKNEPFVILLKKGGWITGTEQRRDHYEGKWGAIIEPVNNLTLEYPIEKTRKKPAHLIRIYLKDIASCDWYDATKYPTYHSDPEQLVKQVAWPRWMEPKVKPAGRKKLLQEIEKNEYGLKYYLVKAIEKGYQAIFEQMLAQILERDGTDVLEESPAYGSLLYYAVKHTRPLVAESLILKGYPLPNKEDQAIILHELKNTGNPTLIKLLLELGFDPNVDMSSQGYDFYILSDMLEMGNSLAVKLLIEHGAKLDLKKDFLDKAIESGNIDCVRLLLEAGIEIRPSAILKALKKEASKFMDILFQQEIDVNVCFLDGTPLLIKLVKECVDVERIEFLVNQGAALDVTFEGKNALAHAKECKYPDSIVEFFEGLGMDLFIEMEEVEAVEAKKAAAKVKAEAAYWASIPSFLKPDSALKKAEEYHSNGFLIRKINGKLPTRKKESDHLQLIGKNIKTHFGLSSHDFNHIAEVRAKLQFLFGNPTGKGDDYKMSFEYQIEVKDKAGVQYYFTIYDWKARTVYSSFIHEGQDEAQIVKADAVLWELIEKASFGDFKAKYSYDEWNKVRYECVDGKPWGDFPDS